MYFEIKSPWPLENRDMLIFEKTVITNKGTKIFLNGKADYIPQKKGIVRIKYITGYWKFLPLENNTVYVEYRFSADPGINAPKWLINLFIVEGPYKTLMNLKSIVEHKKN